MFRLPFLEDTTPPPFYQSQLNDDERTRLDRWFIGHRSQAYYLKRFAQFDQAGQMHARWNWAAFFMTFGWLLYRKRYLDCVVYCVAGWSFIKVNIVIILAICEYLLIGQFAESYQWPLRIAIGAAVWLFWASMVARWADAYYYRMARREIADALALYPQDKDAQKQHLKQEGGVSLVGLSVALSMFGVLLAIFVGQFMPMYVKQQEQKLLLDVYTQASSVARQVDGIIANTGQCPADLLIDRMTDHADIAVVSHADGIATDCAVVATVSDVGYPLGYLNGRKLTIYRTPTDNSLWRCQTSLSKKQTPKRCLD
ncbi:DUF2628 domain-containing protein [Moraxella sp. ZJ142]|uniref:DUF2628 domain-containing protein n=1 Tax=Moraxella marmotae TaxID=3344520 RepID=UPI0035D4E4C0